MPSNPINSGGLKPVTDPNLLAQLNASPSTPDAPKLGPAVTDPTLLAQLNGKISLTPVTDPELLKQLNTDSGTIPVARDTLDTIADVGKGAVKGLATGAQAIAGLPGDAEHGVNWLLSKIMPSAQTLGLKNQGTMPSQALPTTADIDKYVPVSQLPDAETPAGQHAQNIAEFVPGAIGGPENFVKSILTRGILPGAVSDAAGTATQGTALEPYARIAGAMVSPSSAAEKVNPSTSALLDAGSQGFNSFRQMPFAVKPQTMDTWASKTLGDLSARNFDADTAPATVAALQRHVSSTAPFVTAQDMDKTKMLLRNAQASGGHDATAATAALKSLDDRITSFTPSQTVAGDPALAAKTWSEANSNYAAGMRSQAIDALLDKANLQALSKNSGAGSGNQIRSAITNFVTNDAKTRGFTDAEGQAMKDLSKGSFAQNLIRAVSNKLGGGGGIGQMGIIGASAELGGAAGEDLGGSITPGAIAGGLGAYILSKLSRGIYNRSTAKAASNISDLVRSRSPMANAVPDPVQPTVSSPVARLLAAHAAMQQAKQSQ